MDLCLCGCLDQVVWSGVLCGGVWWIAGTVLASPDLPRSVVIEIVEWSRGVAGIDAWDQTGACVRVRKIGV